MTKQELIDFLKENLSITVESNSSWNGEEYGTSDTIKLWLGNELISEDYTSEH